MIIRNLVLGIISLAAFSSAKAQSLPKVNASGYSPIQVSAQEFSYDLRQVTNPGSPFSGSYWNYAGNGYLNYDPLTKEINVSSVAGINDFDVQMQGVAGYLGIQLTNLQVIKSGSRIQTAFQGTIVPPSGWDLIGGYAGSAIGRSRTTGLTPFNSALTFSNVIGSTIDAIYLDSSGALMTSALGNVNLKSPVKIKRASKETDAQFQARIKAEAKRQIGLLDAESRNQVKNLFSEIGTIKIRANFAQSY